MKRSTILFLFIVAAIVQNAAAQSAQITLKRNIMSQAAAMGKAFMSGDIATFLALTYPKAISLEGGNQQMTDALREAMRSLRAKGVTLTGITVGIPSDIVSSGHELQATVSQRTGLVLPDGKKVVATSILLAFSSDSGINWKFMDCSGRDNATMHRLLTNLSSSLTIPKAQ